MNPMDYSFCDQTVTVYRKDGTRQALEGVWYRWEDRLHRRKESNDWERSFLLIVPGEKQQVFIGDRIYPGIGPEEVQWQAFIPATVPGLSEANYAALFHWGTQGCHTEAGCR